MTLQQWRYVLAVIDHGGFSKAADACFVSQPTLSAQIAKLENELGMDLIDRLSRPALPHPDALEIIDRARIAMRSLAALPSIASDMASSASGTLRIGVIPTLSPYLLPRFLRGFLDSFPDLHVEVTEAQSADVLDGIRAFDLDLGIMVPPDDLEGLVNRQLFFEEFVVFLPPGNENPGAIAINRLDRGELLLLAEGHCLRDQVVDLCGDLAVRKRSRVEFQTGSLDSLIALVDQGLGYTLLPELAVETLTEEQRDRCHVIAPTPPVREVGIMYHPAFVRPSLLEATADSVRAGLPPKVVGNAAAARIPWRHLQ